MKILIQTNSQGKLEVVNRDTGEIVEGIKRIRIYTNAYNRPSATIEFKDTDIKLRLKGDDDEG